MSYISWGFHCSDNPYNVIYNVIILNVICNFIHCMLYIMLYPVCYILYVYIILYIMLNNLSGLTYRSTRHCCLPRPSRAYLCAVMSVQQWEYSNVVRYLVRGSFSVNISYMLHIWYMIYYIYIYIYILMIFFTSIWLAWIKRCAIRVRTCESALHK